VIRFAKAFKPRWIVVENVVHMRSWKSYQPWLEALKELGYNVREQVINAADHGVPQARRRLFVMCDLDEVPSEVSGRAGRKKTASGILRGNGRFKFSPLRTKKRAAATLERAERAFAAVGTKKPFLLVYYGSDAAGGWQRVGVPLRTLTTLDRFAYVKPAAEGHQMRMLQVPEIKAAMGFPSSYLLEHGTRREKIKLLGNAVCPPVLTAVLRTLDRSAAIMKTRKIFFRPRARLLLLLGDQLIRDPGVAVFELVKNAFDADSPDAVIRMSKIDDTKNGTIVVEDRGVGMDAKTVTNVWLEPGTDYRIKQKTEGTPTPKYHRVPIGEKGVGRFAAHKLGDKVRLITRKAGSPEVVVEIDWAHFSRKRYLEDVEIQVVERQPRHFTGARTGTRLEITNLRDAWTRSMVRDLARSVNAISSPLGGVGDFVPKLVLDDHGEWISGLLEIKDVLKYSLYRATCVLRGTKLTYEYEFTPFRAMDRITTRKIKRTVSVRGATGALNLDDHNVGPVSLRLFIFDQDAAVLRLGDISDRKGLKEFLNESGGVRVYRGGIRVYDYGERGNDWLGLGGRRVNVPTKRLSNNLIVGAVSLDITKSIDLRRNRGLIEKTNREGFVENADYEVFRDAVVYAIQQIEVERNLDKTRVRNAYRAAAPREPVLEDLTELREIVERKKLSEEIGPYLNRIENDFLAIRDRLLTSATAGLSLSVVIHEVEKGVTALAAAVDADKATHRIRSLAKHLAELVEGYGALVRRSGVSFERASSLISQAVFNLALRLKVHKIELVKSPSKSDFEVKCSRRLVISTIMNLIDNSIWWLDNKWGEQAGKKRLFVAPQRDYTGHPAIVVADNGPGFIDPPEFLVEPFITRKPDGMGLGLHVASEVMKAQGGSLVFPERGDLELPSGIDGAVIALAFKGNK
jgi:anti-sigma regulatory factor (Ser/Thr protein kinase)